MNILQTTDLSIGYGRKVVQGNLSLSAGESDLICLTGTNGAGKSTLLRTLAGLQPLLSGSVSISGRDISTMSSQQKATLFSLVLTDDIDIERLSVRELVAMGRFPYTNWAGSLSARDRLIIDSALANVNLMHKADSLINHISDGEKQRAVIAKALAQDTPLVLLDEPTAHLDLPNRIEIMMLLRHLASSTGKTFILSTHELDLALQMADRIWLMTSSGVEVGLPEDLMLSGSFQLAFGSDAFSFDPMDGHCQVNHRTTQRRINIACAAGGATHASWLRRALLRNGIQVGESVTLDDNEEPYSRNTILCRSDGYLCGNSRFLSIGEVIEYIQKSMDI